MKEIESEKTLEARLVQEVKKRGGIAVKNTSQFHRGLPDRLVLLPYHTMAFVELKTTGKTPTALQHYTQSRLWKMGYTVYVVDSTKTLDEFLDRMDRRLTRMKAHELESLNDLLDEEFSEI